MLFFLTCFFDGIATSAGHVFMPGNIFLTGGICLWRRAKEISYLGRGTSIKTQRMVRCERIMRGEHWLMNHGRWLMKHNWRLVVYNCRPVNYYRRLMINERRPMNDDRSPVHDDVWPMVDLGRWVIDDRRTPHKNRIFLRRFFGLVLFDNRSTIFLGVVFVFLPRDLRLAECCALGKNLRGHTDVGAMRRDRTAGRR